MSNNSFRFYPSKVVKKINKTFLIFSTLFLFFTFANVVNYENRSNFDEGIWINLGIKISRALNKSDFEKTFVSTKPGVTVSYFSGATTIFNRIVSNKDPLSLVRTRSDVLINRFSFALLVALLSGTVFLTLKQLFDRRRAVLMTVLIGLNPIVINKSLSVWTDTLLSLFIVLSLTLFLICIKKGNANKLLLACGVAFGLALATKFVAILLIPSLFLGILLTRASKENLKLELKKLFTVTAVGFVVAFFLQPYLWLNPLAILTRPNEISQDLVYTIGNNHLSLASIFFYPIELVTNDIFLFVFPLICLALLFPTFSQILKKQRPMVFTLVFVVIFTVVAVSISQLQYSQGNVGQSIASLRYILPSVLVLIIFFVDASFFLAKKRFSTLVIFPYTVLVFYLLKLFSEITKAPI